MRNQENFPTTLVDHYSGGKLVRSFRTFLFVNSKQVLVKHFYLLCFIFMSIQRCPVTEHSTHCTCKCRTFSQRQRLGTLHWCCDHVAECQPVRHRLHALGWIREKKAALIDHVSTHVWSEEILFWFTRETHFYEGAHPINKINSFFLLCQVILEFVLSLSIDLSQGHFCLFSILCNGLNKHMHMHPCIAFLPNFWTDLVCLSWVIVTNQKFYCNPYFSDPV